MFPILKHKVNYCQHLFCSKVSNTIEELASLDSFRSQQKEMASARVERDNIEISWKFRFCNHNPFIASEKLVSRDSGLVGENDTVNRDKAETIGTRIQKPFDNQVFGSCSFKRKDLTTNLQSLYSSITID